MDKIVKNISNRRKGSGERSAGSVKVIASTMVKGEIKWRVTDGQKVRTLTTSKRSLRSIDEAVKKFGPALTRLANQ